MCGIAGYINLNGHHLDPQANFLPEMCRQIHHRGPDEQGMMVRGPLAFGMTRLSIIDLATGQQPISNEDGTIWIVFNGEIYNFRELTESLKRRGHQFKTNSDTETIVHLYEEHGIDCLKFLEGMFAFAIWDERQQRLFIARDRMGEKPLYWGVFGNQFLFGSELKTLLVHPSVTRELNPHALRQYLALEYVPAPSSIFNGINKLMPAHFMLVDRGKVKVDRYWSMNGTGRRPLNISETEAKERLRDLLDQSIRGRMISDVPLGVFLSGGIDSSVIAALAARQTSHSLRTFSIGFSDPSFDESAHAKAVAEHLGTVHEVIPFQPEVAYDTLEELFEVLDEPIGDASIIPTFLLSTVTKRSVTVALSGEGGDELLGGYPTYTAHSLSENWNLIPAGLRQGIIEPLLNKLPVSMNNLSFDYKVKRFIAGAALQPVRRQLRWMGSLPLQEQELLLRDEILDAARYESEEQLISHIDIDTLARSSSDVIDGIMRLDVATYLADDLLFKSDRSTMAASLEGRLPFLAYPVVEFAFSLPTSYKIRGFETKRILRKLAAEYLPPHIVKRPKKGFGIPVARWLNNDFRSMVDELMNESFIQRQGIFQWNTLRAMLDEHRSGRVDRRKELWTLLMFQRWWSKYFVSSNSVTPARCEAVCVGTSAHGGRQHTRAGDESARVGVGV